MVIVYVAVTVLPSSLVYRVMLNV